MDGMEYFYEAKKLVMALVELIEEHHLGDHHSLLHYHTDEKTLIWAEKFLEITDKIISEHERGVRNA